MNRWSRHSLALVCLSAFTALAAPVQSADEADSRGMNVYTPMAVNQVQDGRSVGLAPSREAKVQYPPPAWGQR